MDKQEYIKSLKNVKIVLGNGFDLHCGLHSKYSDYYCKNYEKFFFIKDLIIKYKESEILDLDFNDKRVQSINTWDVFFVMNSPSSPSAIKKDWCDVERLIYCSLIQYNNDTSDASKIAVALGSIINWNRIHAFLFANSLATNHDERFVVEFIKNRAKFIKFNHKDFYGFLLKELNNFEKDFGQFIYKQFHNTYMEVCSYGTKKVFNSDYSYDANYTINELCDENNLVSIDSFNYSSIEKVSLNSKFQNINGSYESPIFGIDTKFKPNEKQFLFTKTARRINADMFSDTFNGNPQFENVIIYGHSLDEADYSYFFPLFDKLNLIDSTASGVLVFAYSVYDEEKKNEIEADFRRRMVKIIYDYANSKHVPEPERLLDSLSTQKRVIVYLLNDISFAGRPRRELDRDWDKIYGNLDLVIKYREKNNM